MSRESKKYFPLTLESLRALGSWAADCAERALPVYEKHVESDPRPRASRSGRKNSRFFTPLLADVEQTKHIVGPAAYAALALELDRAGRQSIGDGEVRWAIEHVTPEVREVLLQMPARQSGKSRLDMLLYEEDAGIRGRTLPQDA